MRSRTLGRGWVTIDLCHNICNWHRGSTRNLNVKDAIDNGQHVEASMFRLRQGDIMGHLSH